MPEQSDDPTVEVERLAAEADKPNPWPSDNESYWWQRGWSKGTQNALEKFGRPLLAEVERLRALDATCICESGPDYEGPQPACAIHGAIQAYNKAQAEVERLREERARACSALSDQGRAVFDSTGDLEDGINATLLSKNAEIAGLVNALVDIREKRDRLAAKVQRARAEHPRIVHLDQPCCGACETRLEEPHLWPCPTIQALDGGDE